jgi:hypothetical protein
MSTNEIEPMRLPDDMVTITPVADGLTFAYQQAPDGTDLIALIVKDRLVDTVRTLFTIDAARVTSATLAAMVNDLDNLRSEWKDAQR